MKIKCQRNVLLKGLQTVFRAVSTKNAIPAAGGILLTANRDCLTFQATDFEIAIRYQENDFSLEEEGSLVLPGRTFYEIAKKLPDTELALDTEEQTMTIRYDEAKIEINGFDPEEFPLLPQVNPKISGVFNLETLKRNLREVIVAISVDESRPIFTGVLMEIEPERVNFIATDTHRLALKKSAWESENDGSALLVIPGKILLEILKIPAENNPAVRIEADERQVSFAVEDSLFISRLIEGKFPNYRQVIPGEDRILAKAIVDGNRLFSILERATVMSREGTGARVGKVRLEVSDGKMVVDAASPEVGRIHEVLPVYFEGEPMSLFLNAQYLLAILKVIDDADVVMDFTGNASPLVLRRKDDGSYLYLALPIKM